MSPTPTLLLVHGAWHGTGTWRALLDEQSELDVRVVPLPSVGPAPVRLGDLRADTAAVRAAATSWTGRCWCAPTPTAE